MPISIAARQRVVTGLWGGRKAGSFAGRAPTVLAAITGTATASITEADLVVGGRTVIITLTNETWATAGASFDAQRQAIINGLDSAQAEATGWNTVIRDAEVVGAVIRTSDTVVTITLSAAASYDITAAETITVTVPSSALVTSLVDVTGTPTFTVSAVAEVSQEPSGRWEPRRRLKTIRRADFVHQQEYAEALAQALAAASVPLSRVTETGEVIGEDETDDEILLIALTRILH